MKKPNATIRAKGRRGTTLTEMIVAVAITISMIGTIGVVFKSASDAASKAAANNMIMQDLRSLSQQLNEDFTSLRNDLPFAVLWEGHDFAYGPNGAKADPANQYELIRYDRIVFFATGDYQANDFQLTSPTISGNLAQIFYGQNEDYRAVNYPASSLIPESILCRRLKILTADSGTDWNIIYLNSILPCNPENCQGNGVLTANMYDWIPIWNTTADDWKNYPFGFYFTNFFNSNPFYNLSNPSNIYDVLSKVSLLRRPDIRCILNDPSINYSALTQLILSKDVTHFKIELWFPGALDWFPNESDLAAINAVAGLRIPFYNFVVPGFTNRTFGFYWNTPEDPAMIPSVGKTQITGIDWRGETGIENLRTGVPALGWTDVWPEAVKFTFTLYDRNRRFSPTGQTYEFIVKVPPRS